MFNTEKRKGIFRIKYILIICTTIVVTLISFSLLFFSKENSEFLNDLKNKSNDSSTPLNESVTPAASEQIDELKAELAKYQSFQNSNYLVIVNSEKPLEKDYSPSNLETMTSNSALKMVKEAKEQAEALLSEALSNGYNYTLLSCYRDYAAQETAYNKAIQSNMSAGYNREDAEKLIKTVVAAPGESEYATGLIFEVAVTRTMTSPEFKDTPLYNYLIENAHKYGFVLRYPEDKEHITGYNFNACAFRYVGSVESSTYMKDKKLTLEEYSDYVQREITVITQKISALESGGQIKS